MQLSTASTRSQRTSRRPSSAYVYIGLIFGILFSVSISSGAFFILRSITNNTHGSVAYAAPVEKHVQVGLSIVINQPGMQKDWPGYTPSSIVVPAHSLVTVTIRNYDLGDTALPANSAFAQVQGVVGDTATADGQSYAIMSPDKVAHTFTVQQLGLNVPIPGDAPAGKDYVEVSFTFHTGAAGLYYFRCYDPCGTGNIGWQGPMVTKGYMLGTIVVQG